jgi:hypothetical protein
MLVVRGDSSGQVQVMFADGQSAVVDRRALTLTGKTRITAEHTGGRPKGY